MSESAGMDRRLAAVAEGTAAAALHHELGALALADERRRALGLFLRHLARGERIAERIAGRQVALAPDARAARFFRSQARQERLHARVFDMAAGWLHAGCDVPRDPYDAYEQRLQRQAERGDYAETVVGTQIVLEALGEVLLARLECGLARSGAGFRTLRRMMLAQEATHHAFGRAAIASMLEAGALATPLIDTHVATYRRLAQPMIAAAAPVLRHFALTADDIANDLDTRLRDAAST